MQRCIARRARKVRSRIRTVRASKGEVAKALRELVASTQAGPAFGAQPRTVRLIARVLHRSLGGFVMPKLLRFTPEFKAQAVRLVFELMKPTE